MCDLWLVPIIICSASARTLVKLILETVTRAIELERLT